MVAQTDGEQVYPLCQRIKSKRALGYPHTASMSPGATRVKGSPASTQLDSPAEHPSLPTPPLVYQKVTCDWPYRPWLLALTSSCLNSNHLLQISWTLPCLPPLCGLFLFWVSSCFSVLSFFCLFCGSILWESFSGGMPAAWCTLTSTTELCTLKFVI